MKENIGFIVCIALLCGCGTVNTETAATSVTTAAAVSETTEEITAAETTDAPETATIEETAVSEEELREYIEITADTKFYECEYTQEKVVNAEDYADKNGIENAMNAFKDSDVFKGLEEKAEQSKAEYPVFENSEFVYDIDCDKVLVCDFDGDGAEDNAYLFYLSPVFPETTSDDEVPVEISYFYSVVDINSNNILVLENGNGGYYVSDYFYAIGSELYELRYNGFSHIVVDGGLSNNSSCADFFSLNDGEFELELRESGKYGIMDNAFLVQNMAQCYNMWLIFWNEDNKCYVTPETEAVSAEEMTAIPVFEGKEINFGCTIGNSIYGSTFGEVDTYIITGNVAELLEEKLADSGLFAYSIGERKVAMGREFYIPYAKNFDYETALKNLVSLN